MGRGIPDSYSYSDFVELMRRAQRIVSHPRMSPELDDATADHLRRTARKLQNDARIKLSNSWSRT